MKRCLQFLWFGWLVLTALGLVGGCTGAVPHEEVRPKDRAADKDQAAQKKTDLGTRANSDADSKNDTNLPASSKKATLGKNVFLEVLPNKKRRVLVGAEVCLREGPLEQLLCRKQTKEHEAILTADVDARNIHAALIAAGAKEGSPVRFVPRYQPASGTTIKVSLQYKNKDGKLVTEPAQSWIKNAKTNQLLQSDWVFAGSRLVTNPLDPDGQKYYLANDGDIICVSNFETALLDLPIPSPKDNAELAFVANTERIPPLGTKVTVILEPIVEEKKK